MPFWLITGKKFLSAVLAAHYSLREYLSYNTNFTPSIVYGGLPGLPQYSAYQELSSRS